MAMNFEQNAEAEMAMNPSPQLQPAEASMNATFQAQERVGLPPNDARRIRRMRKISRQTMGDVMVSTFPPTELPEITTINPASPEFETTMATPFPTFAQGGFNRNAESPKRPNAVMSHSDPRAMEAWEAIRRKHVATRQKRHRRPMQVKPQNDHLDAIINVELPGVVPEILDEPLGIINQDPVNGLAGGLLSNIG